MNLFINDIPVRITAKDILPHEGEVNHGIDASLEAITKAGLIHHVWIKMFPFRIWTCCWI